MRAKRLSCCFHSVECLHSFFSRSLGSAVWGGRGEGGRNQPRLMCQSPLFYLSDQFRQQVGGRCPQLVFFVLFFVLGNDNVLFFYVMILSLLPTLKTCPILIFESFLGKNMGGCSFAHVKCMRTLHRQGPRFWRRGEGRRSAGGRPPRPALIEGLRWVFRLRQKNLAFLPPPIRKKRRLFCITCWYVELSLPAAVPGPYVDG